VNPLRRWFAWLLGLVGLGGGCWSRCFCTGPDDLNWAWVTLSATAGGNKIKVWENATKGTEVSLPKTWNMPGDTVPATS